MPVVKPTRWMSAARSRAVTSASSWHSGSVSRQPSGDRRQASRAPCPASTPRLARVGAAIERPTDARHLGLLLGREKDDIQQRLSPEAPAADLADAKHEGAVVGPSRDDAEGRRRLRFGLAAHLREIGPLDVGPRDELDE